MRSAPDATPSGASRVIVHSATEYKRVSPATIEAYRQLSQGDLAGVVARALDVLGVVGTIPSSLLQPILPGRSLIGTAFTVRNVPERIVPFRGWSEGLPTRMGERDAFFLVQPGDVVVIDGSTVYPASCLGSVAVVIAGRLGAAGVIVSGAVTGVPGIRAAGYPVWSRGGTTVTGHHRVDTVEVEGVIGVHGVRVEPGDLIVADDSGVSVVPSDDADRVIGVVHRMARSGRELRRLLDADLDRDALRAELGRFMTALARTASEA